MSKKSSPKNNPNDEIIVKGARTHNLKNITVSMPRGKMVVISGLSGSGKSSLAFDTIFAEGQRRYIESLSAYARQFLRQMQKPDVDEIIGLSPAISIDQKSRSNNPRSTVATITEIYDYLRILYARIGRPHCVKCDREIKKLSNDEIFETILETVKEFSKETKEKVMDVEIDKDKVKIYAPVVVGRKGEYYQLLYDLLDKGFESVLVDGKEYKLRERIDISKTKKHNIDVLIDEFYATEIKKFSQDTKERLSEAIERALDQSQGLLRVAYKNSFKLISSKFMCPYDGFSFPEVEPRLFSFNSPYGACEACNGLGTKHLYDNDPCDVCNGARLREEALHVFLNQTGENKSIVEVTNLSIRDAIEYFTSLDLTDTEYEIAKVVLKEIESRLNFMNNVGIEYISLSRKAHTLSGGEAQRIRLASQLGSGLVGALYVLDEPTIGLHSRDNDRLIKTLLELRDLGNTVIVVEHDEDTIFAADYLIDIGPGAGVHGGEVVVSGHMNELLSEAKYKNKSLTLDYLRGDISIEVPKKRRNFDAGKLRVKGGEVFNISNLNIEVPLGKLLTVTGVSGSGKSSFVHEILYKNLQAKFDRKHRSNKVYHCKEFSGEEYVSRTIMIDQSSIGRTPRSNPATYTGAWSHIRDMFAATEEARYRGWKAGRFSFNVKGGRCEACQGNGQIAVEMHFLPTVYVLCEVCNGKRFMKETLDVKFKNKNIHDVLKMTVEDALEFFKDIPAISDRLFTLNEVGLGYLELGQSATTLSGGEAQRVKISSELYRAHVQKTIYILDEPTIGLHYEDVKKLIEILQKLVDKGNTVIVIEHNMDLIKSSDYIIDIGPEGGVGGGKIVAKGTPEQVAQVKESYTGQYLKKVLKKK